MLSQHDPLSVLLITDHNPFGRPLTNDYLDELDATGFWQADPTLTFIAAIAYDTEVSRWSLLSTLIAHRMSHVPPNVVLVDKKGRRGLSVTDGMSLNWFSVLSGRTGAGKSETIRIARMLIPPRCEPESSGTGQGFLRYLAETVKETKDAQGTPLVVPRIYTRMLNHTLLIHAPEITQLTAEMDRLGSQTSSMMRNLYVGETTGTLTGDRDRRVLIRRNTVRTCFVYGSQHDTAGRILGEYREGTPQRFIWSPVLDYRQNLAVPASRPGFMLTRPAICDAASSGTQFASQVSVSTDTVPFDWDLLPVEIDATTPAAPAVWVDWSPQMHADIAALRVAARAADSNPYEESSPAQDARRRELEVQSHALLGRINSAVGIAFLCGRSHITDLDWQLSGVYAAMSLAEVAGMWEMCKKSAKAMAESAGTSDGIRREAQERYQTGQADEMKARLTDAVRVMVERYVAQHGAVFTARDLQRKQTSKGRYSSSEIRGGIHELVIDGAVAHVKGTQYMWLG